MLRPSILVVALSLVTAACGGDAPPKAPKISEVLPNIPLPPNATFVSKAGGVDALQITVRSPLRSQEVEDYYRKLFKTNNWRLVNDAKDADGAIVLFAEQKGPPLWVRIRSAGDGGGTLVDIAGARITPHDSTKASSTTSKPTS